MSGGEGNEEVKAISHRQRHENQIHILELGAVAIAVIITHSLSAVCTSEPATHPHALSLVATEGVMEWSNYSTVAWLQLNIKSKTPGELTP